MPEVQVTDYRSCWELNRIRRNGRACSLFLISDTTPLILILSPPLHHCTTAPRAPAQARALNAVCRETTQLPLLSIHRYTHPSTAIIHQSLLPVATARRIMLPISPTLSLPSPTAFDPLHDRHVCHCSLSDPLSQV